MNRAFICAALLANLCAPAWAVYKCAGPTGAPVYQDAPCAGKGEKIHATPAAGEANPVAVGRAAKDLDEIQRSNAINDAIAAGRPLIGMTKSELDQAMGAPTTDNADNYNGRQKNQLIYRRPKQTYYVYTENGLVTAIQDRPETSSPSRAVNCPTDLQIRNMETSASSKSLTASESQALQERIGLMRGCVRR